MLNSADSTVQGARIQNLNVLTAEHVRASFINTNVSKDVLNARFNAGDQLAHGIARRQCPRSRSSCDERVSIERPSLGVQRRKMSDVALQLYGASRVWRAAESHRGAEASSAAPPRATEEPRRAPPLHREPPRRRGELSATAAAPPAPAGYGLPQRGQNRGASGHILLGAPHCVQNLGMRAERPDMVGVRVAPPPN